MSKDDLQNEYYGKQASSIEDQLMNNQSPLSKEMAMSFFRSHSCMVWEEQILHSSFYRDGGFLTSVLQPAEPFFRFMMIFTLEIVVTNVWYILIKVRIVSNM
jgi:hypothetical protein